MILKYYSDDYILLYINEDKITKVNIYGKENVETFVKKLVISLKKTYDINLNGIYSFIIYLDSGFGSFIKIKKIDSLFSKETIDFRVEVISDCTFYFKTEDYFAIERYKDIYFYNNYYYVELNSNFDIMKYCELGEIVFDEFLKIKDKCLKI